VKFYLGTADNEKATLNFARSASDQHEIVRATFWRTMYVVH